MKPPTKSIVLKSTVKTPEVASSNSKKNPTISNDLNKIEKDLIPTVTLGFPRDMIEQDD